MTKTPLDNIAVIIPFRDRGIDLRRQANLDAVMAWWWLHGFEPQIVDDGLSGDAQFNRHRAYNRAVEANPDTDVFVFTEADMIIAPEQIKQAVAMADDQPGLVVPFTQYRYLDDETTMGIRESFIDMAPDRLVIELAWGWPFDQHVERVIDNGDSVGAVNVVSRNTLEITGGFTELTEGNWYDDNIIEEGFAFLTGNPTRHVTGPAVHLYHLPGWTGDHLTDADRAATAYNKRLLSLMRYYIRTHERGLARAMLASRKDI